MLQILLASQLGHTESEFLCNNLHKNLTSIIFK